MGVGGLASRSYAGTNALIVDQAARAGLLVTGGSDFHCADGERARLGCYSTPVWSVAAISAAKQQMA